jgi:hypothetical protein
VTVYISICCSIIPFVVLLVFIELVRSWDGTGVIHRRLFGGSIVWHNKLVAVWNVETRHLGVPSVAAQHVLVTIDGVWIC